MKKLTKTLLIGLMIATLAGCETIARAISNDVPEVKKPTVSVFLLDNNVCFTEDDAKEFFGYVFTLENTLEDLR